MEPRSLNALGCLALAVLVAGCTAAPQPAPLDPAVAQGAADIAEGATATLAPQPVVTPFSYEGTTPTASCAYSPATGEACVGSSGTNSFYELETEGTPLRLSATVTWTAASPATQQLRAFVLHLEGDTWRWNQGDPIAEGTSPLLLEADLAALNSTGYALVVNAFRGTGAAVAFAGATLPQDFAVEGTVAALPVAA